MKKLPGVASRNRDGICVLHEADGIHRVLADTGAMRTKRARAMETAFPVLTEVGTSHPSNQSYGTIIIDLGSQSDVDENKHLIEDEPVEPIALEHISPMDQEFDTDSSSQQW